jgi:hypothetical protein
MSEIISFFYAETGYIEGLDTGLDLRRAQIQDHDCVALRHGITLFVF